MVRQAPCWPRDEGLPRKRVFMQEIGRLEDICAGLCPHKYCHKTFYGCMQAELQAIIDSHQYC
jgi:hypothetical protein